MELCVESFLLVSFLYFINSLSEIQYFPSVHRRDWYLAAFHFWRKESRGGSRHFGTWGWPQNGAPVRTKEGIREALHQKWGEINIEICCPGGICHLRSPHLASREASPEVDSSNFLQFTFACHTLFQRVSHCLTPAVFLVGRDGYKWKKELPKTASSPTPFLVWEHLMSKVLLMGTLDPTLCTLNYIWCTQDKCVIER